MSQAVAAYGPEVAAFDGAQIVEWCELLRLGDYGDGFVHPISAWESKVNLATMYYDYTVAEIDSYFMKSIAAASSYCIDGQQSVMRAMRGVCRFTEAPLACAAAGAEDGEP